VTRFRGLSRDHLIYFVLRTMAESSRMRWELHREALESLLAALHADRDTASIRYETLRRKLIDFFSWQKCTHAEDLADEALNRLARRVHEGETIQGLDRYAFGIARLSLKEEERSRQVRTRALRELQSPAPEEEDHAVADRMIHCLNALPRESRELIERYYSEDRTALASTMGTTMNALRNRAMRVREKLFDCMMRRQDRDKS
jgi:DNA-directed RNA polymerase specialized sigma24 family protein